MRKTMKCDQNCTSCATRCHIPCPVCGKIGQLVAYETVNHLINQPCHFFENEEIYICTSKKCEAVYYQENNPTIYFKKDLLVPVWYKEKYNQFLVCYCHNIYLHHIVEVVKGSTCNHLTKKDILKILSKSENENCKQQNPTGQSCDILFQNAIEFAYKQKRGE